MWNQSESAVGGTLSETERSIMAVLVERVCLKACMHLVFISVFSIELAGLRRRQYSLIN